MSMAYNKGLLDAQVCQKINYVQPPQQISNEQYNQPALPPINNNDRRIVPYNPNFRQNNRFQPRFQQRQNFRQNYNPQMQNRQYRQRFQQQVPFAHPNRQDFCYFHRKFGVMAQKCSQPCLSLIHI